MKTELTISVRAFPVTIQDQRTGVKSLDIIVLDKAQLQAIQLIGQSSRELIYHLYNRQGYKVLDIGTPEKRNLVYNLSEAYKEVEAVEY